VLAETVKSFLGPLRVSVMLDTGGANTTAAAAVLAARRHLDLAGAEVLMLAGTGPVGRRAARLLAGQGAVVRLASRQQHRAEEARQSVLQTVGSGNITALKVRDEAALLEALDGAAVVISAGPPSAELIPDGVLQQCKSLQVAIDLSAVPPLGIACVKVTDKAQQRGHLICYGALGVGGTKMNIHRAAIAKLFTANDLVLDAEEIFALGVEMEKDRK
jgi:hypothetical protein